MMLRRSFLMLAFALASTWANGEDAASFQSFRDGLWRDAAARGIKRTTFEVAFAGVTPDAAVLAAMRRQPDPVPGGFRSRLRPGGATTGETGQSRARANSAEAAGDAARTPLANSPRAVQASLDTLFGLHNHEP